MIQVTFTQYNQANWQTKIKTGNWCYNSTNEEVTSYLCTKCARERHSLTLSPSQSVASGLWSSQHGAHLQDTQHSASTPTRMQVSTDVIQYFVYKCLHWECIF